jgi:dGTPase
MEWKTLLTTSRLGRETEPPSTDVRSEFQRDADRIVYSSAFRRMQDKTQVFPLAQSDYVRTRLTHSIEVAAVGRSLGTLAGAVARDTEDTEVAPPSEFGNVVAAACLAHDIGNPPFGHSGESAIRSWFEDRGQEYLREVDEAAKTEFLKFEGNAQGFRILTRLQQPQNRGGLRLTHATLAVFSKYPCASIGHTETRPDDVSAKKFGFFRADEEHFRTVAKNVGLVEVGQTRWCRHPLTFLMEAADDICYRVIDLEDGCRVGRVPFEIAETLLRPIATAGGDRELEADYERIADEKGKVEFLRARAISELINAVRDSFREHYAKLMDGSFREDLISVTRFAEELKRIKAESVDRVYSVPHVVEIETAGFEILGGLLDRFVPALLWEPGAKGAHAKFLDLIPRQYRGTDTAYARILAATDFVSGMTDGYALTLFRRLTGMELPRS